MAEPVAPAAPTRESLRAELDAHLLARPALPEGYDPHSAEGKAFYEARLAWSATWRHLEHELWKLENPKMVFQRVPPRVVPRPHVQGPVRFRR